ncbi:pilus assembly protein [Cellulomonas composti]|uniref:Pilus assembly protein TadE n=1 Tax=Cellulomonas composti TaxID=266130 RepID=A0A511JBV4_9CELL|nr:pilus assembly protein [Cellulomonas composti]GEL95454.1 hypothetical protein CCO02nite_21120 [Cellulomonas composti]
MSHALIRRITADDPEAGSAVIEFLGLVLVLLVPLVYLVLVLGRLEAATFAVEGAARESARVLSAADDDDSGLARAQVVTGLALEDQGFGDGADALRVTCEADPCVTPDAAVTAVVQVRVPLPFVPSFVRSVVPLEVPVSSSRTAVVDRYRETGGDG